MQRVWSFFRVWRSPGLAVPASPPGQQYLCRSPSHSPSQLVPAHVQDHRTTTSLFACSTPQPHAGRLDHADQASIPDPKAGRCMQQHPWSTAGSMRGFASSTSPVTESAHSPASTQAPIQAVTAEPSTSSRRAHTDQPTAWPRWDWAYVAGSAPSRKPAIKRPSRHQWLFCNPKYDPNTPLPPKMLPPYAPITAQQQDEQQVYHKLKPHHRQRSNRRFKQEYQRWLALRDVDWRNAFQTGLAADTKAAAKETRREKERARQEAWAEYKAALFQEAAAGGPGVGSGDSSR